MRRGDSSAICRDVTVFIEKSGLLDTNSGAACRGHCLIADLVDGYNNYGAAMATACLENSIVHISSCGLIQKSSQ
jgi:hypothetical protein